MDEDTAKIKQFVAWVRDEARQQEARGGTRGQSMKKTDCLSRFFSFDRAPAGMISCGPSLFTDVPSPP